MFVPYAPASDGAVARAAGHCAGVPPPTRVLDEVGDHGTAVPAVTEGLRVVCPVGAGALEVGDDERVGGEVEAWDCVVVGGTALVEEGSSPGEAEPAVNLAEPPGLRLRPATTMVTSTAPTTPATTQTPRLVGRRP
ncbi:MAG TPA: hypothetical protein VFN61_17095 [Acidimicrobiales bacterium]|nr:hypothetical protein [Acidimicrobiales bacterium]